MWGMGVEDKAERLVLALMVAVLSQGMSLDDAVRLARTILERLDELGK